ncbi:uncharacterized protein EV422DRAFT_522727 [Fimicolochytrium jonesii]|uniref:uncharacterized protein n=1 Tax=Fimicolochytrium jonesii TaxID=1396493 RepID=UPI0022FE5C47|nr:uncharacterized protein EV422DRAFT_522727 [Fimicolochytrium jonesii]KAI8822930.1 hypothetical protein EV422DRAFT_522727 [Fimicolochytrium jonesii]
MPSLHGASASQLDTQSQGSPHQLAGNLAKTKEEEDDMEQRSEFLLRKQEVKEAQKAYMLRHPELGDIMADYLQLILHRKPEDVYAFTAEYFSL